MCPFKYINHAKVQQSLIKWGLPFLRHIPNTSYCLELGAGTGLLTQYLVKKHKHVYATDIDPQMINFGAVHVPQAHWHYANAWKNNLSSAMAVVYSASLLQWAPDPKSVLAHWANAIIPGGYLMGILYIHPSLKTLENLIHVPVQWKTQNEWLDALAFNSFQIIDYRQKAYFIEYSCAIQALRMLKYTGIPLGINPNNDLNTIIKASRHLKAANKVILNWEFFGFVARKN